MVGVVDIAFALKVDVFFKLLVVVVVDFAVDGVVGWLAVATASVALAAVAGLSEATSVLAAVPSSGIVVVL